MNKLMKSVENIDYCEIIKRRKIRFPQTIGLEIAKYILNHPQEKILFNLAKYIDNNHNALTLDALDRVANSFEDKLLRTLYFWKRQRRHDLFDATGSHMVFSIKYFTDKELKHFLNTFDKSKKLIVNEIMGREIYSQGEINV